MEIDPLLQKIKPNKSKSNIHRKIFPPPFPDHIPVHPFRFLICGAGQTGKTTLLLALLTKPEFYRDYFDLFILVSPNIHHPQWAKALKTLQDRSDIYDDFSPSTEASIKETLQENNQIKTKDGELCAKKILIVFDDMIDDKRLVNGSFLTTLFTRGRHYCASVVFSTQLYVNFPLRLRKQMTNIIIFASSNSKEVDAVYEEYCHQHLTRKEFDELFKDATNGKYKFLYIDTRSPNPAKKYRSGFCNFYEIIPPESRSVAKIKDKTSQVSTINKTVDKKYQTFISNQKPTPTEVLLKRKKQEIASLFTQS
jgi:hypothetical protein